MNNQYLNQIKKTIENVSGIDPTEIQKGSYFEDDLNIGELEMLEILAELEEVYNIEIVEQKDDIETIEDLIDLIIEQIE